ncbi:MAG: hypothetical protein IPH62_15845 [Ignavibacteriae bacterium]|nr:hypothetical protein [Ignavibacteriota bacterium]
MKNFTYIILSISLVIISLILFINCSDKIVEPKQEPLNVDIRMEVQVLDSTFQIYKRPFTQIYFTTYKLTSNKEKVEILQSDTTSCRNGWGVKLLNYKLTSIDQKIILGASCENYNGPNYREIEIDFAEAERRIDTLRHSNIVKTFAIYYK